MHSVPFKLCDVIDQTTNQTHVVAVFVNKWNVCLAIGIKFPLEKVSNQEIKVFFVFIHQSTVGTMHVHILHPDSFSFNHTRTEVMLQLLHHTLHIQLVHCNCLAKLAVGRLGPHMARGKNSRTDNRVKYWIYLCQITVHIDWLFYRRSQCSHN